MLIREAVACGFHPIVMEYFTAETTSDRRFLREAIASADIFIIVLGARYGSQVGAGSGTFTELEYETALGMNKPILPFCLMRRSFGRHVQFFPRDIPNAAMTVTYGIFGHGS